MIEIDYRYAYFQIQISQIQAEGSPVGEAI